MIQFPCKCGFGFEVPQDLAGGAIQCPECGLLADVPTLQDLPNLNQDGTFGFVDRESRTSDATDIHLSFVNKTIDASGHAKDLRRSIEDFKTIGLAEHIAPRPAPRYDPSTGELIRPLQLKDETPVPVISLGELVDAATVDEDPEEVPQAVVAIPTAPARELGYATGDARKQVTLKTLGVELLMPGNVAVMFFVFVFYILGYYCCYGIVGYVSDYWPFLILNLPLWVVIAHTGVVIETTGPDAVDELPRPLRDISLGEDFFVPMLRTILAGVICATPLLLAIHFLNHFKPATLPLLLLLGILGASFAPAVLLTSITGTTVLNLRPDRVMEVIRQCGGNYLISIALFTAMLLPSTFYLAGQLILRHHMENPLVEVLSKPAVRYPMMGLSVYLLHFFCWHLGMMYRQHHDSFPWLAQRHIKEEKTISVA